MVVCAVQDAVYKHEGSLNKFLVDDKGSTLVAVFGLPPLAHQDDPTRGLLTAIALSETLHKLFLKCALGVTSGVALCGPVGSGSRREYSVLGDVVNTSARLMQAAAKTAMTHDGVVFDGCILCDELTMTSASHCASIVFETLPPLALKGKATVSAIFQPGWKGKRLSTRAREASGGAEGDTGRGEQHDVVQDLLSCVSVDIIESIERMATSTILYCTRDMTREGKKSRAGARSTRMLGKLLRHGAFDGSGAAMAQGLNPLFSMSVDAVDGGSTEAPAPALGPLGVEAGCDDSVAVPVVGSRLVVLTGDVGSGKTTLLHNVVGLCAERCDLAFTSVDVLADSMLVTLLSRSQAAPSTQATLPSGAATVDAAISASVFPCVRFMSAVAEDFQPRQSCLVWRQLLLQVWKRQLVCG